MTQPEAEDSACNSEMKNSPPASEKLPAEKPEQQTSPQSPDSNNNDKDIKSDPDEAAENSDDVDDDFDDFDSDLASPQDLVNSLALNVGPMMATLRNKPPSIPLSDLSDNTPVTEEQSENKFIPAQDVDDELKSLTWLHDWNLLRKLDVTSLCAAASGRPALIDEDLRLFSSLNKADDYLAVDLISPQSAASVGTTSSGDSSQPQQCVPSSTKSTPQGSPSAGKLNIDCIKPPYSLSTLIFLAMEDSDTKMMQAKDIYKWILSHFPYYRNASPAWKNSIRHSLSLNRCFMKVMPSDGRPQFSRGSYWCINPVFRETLLQAVQKAPFHPNYAQIKEDLHQLVRGMTDENAEKTKMQYTFPFFSGVPSPKILPFLQSWQTNLLYLLDGLEADLAASAFLSAPSERVPKPRRFRAVHQIQHIPEEGDDHSYSFVCNYAPLRNIEEAVITRSATGSDTEENCKVPLNVKVSGRKAYKPRKRRQNVASGDKPKRGRPRKNVALKNEDEDMFVDVETVDDDDAGDLNILEADADVVSGAGALLQLAQGNMHLPSSTTDSKPLSSPESSENTAFVPAISALSSANVSDEDQNAGKLNESEDEDIDVVSKHVVLKNVLKDLRSSAAAHRRRKSSGRTLHEPWSPTVKKSRLDSSYGLRHKVGRKTVAK